MHKYQQIDVCIYQCEYSQIYYMYLLNYNLAMKFVHIFLNT